MQMFSSKNQSMGSMETFDSESDYITMHSFATTTVFMHR